MFKAIVFSFAAAIASVAAPLTAAAAPPPTAVLIGGLGTTEASSFVDFEPLVQQLGPLGLPGSMPWRVFSYGPIRLASCATLGWSTHMLANFLRNLRDHGLASSVVLVGHSNGGAVALDLPAAFPDLAPFIRRIVTVDSPLGGVSALQRDAFIVLAADRATAGNGTYCPAIDDLHLRYATPGWSDYLGQLVGWEQAQGIDVEAVVNPEDWYVTVDEQQLPAENVNVSIDAIGPNMNHSGVLHAPDAVAQLAAIVTAP